MQKTLSIAFIWHFHQPSYKSKCNELYLMPWVRLHAVKDYLDMVTIVEKYPQIKLNINLSPTLLDAIEDYVDNSAHDIHSKLTVTPFEQLSVADKVFILNNFFDANYTNMILPNKDYLTLYKKRFSKNEPDVELFSAQEYSDLMVYFNLCWIDSVWLDEYSDLKYLVEKGKNYSLEDRKLVIDIHRQIMKKIIPTYKKMQEDGRVEFLTNPYFHPIMPLLVDVDDAYKTTIPNNIPPISSMKEDLSFQIKSALERIEKVFGKCPRGIWTSEQAISQEVCDLMAENGIFWTISDEGILAKTLGKEFIRDFRGYLEDPFDICQIYNYENNNKNIHILFRDSNLPNLINFEYPNHSQENAAIDFYERIKAVQERLLYSPTEENILTIAMDGENCWENYSDDGKTFLNKVYKLIEQDENLKTVLISEYVQKNTNTIKINSTASGSGINRNYQLWIDEPVKNFAWTCINDARKALIEFESKVPEQKEEIKKAWWELYTSQSSDWFWWFGEPNHSPQDCIFDYLFREYVKNVYTILNIESPQYLEQPLQETIFQTIPKPQNANWDCAGCLNVPSGPVLQNNKLYHKVYWGCDNDNLYLKFLVNKFLFDEQINRKNAEIYIYLKNKNTTIKESAPLLSAFYAENLSPILSNRFTHVIKLNFEHQYKQPPQLAIASKNGLWAVKMSTRILYAYDDVLEVKIPFSEIDAQKGTELKFLVTNGANGICETYYPKDELCSLICP